MYRLYNTYQKLRKARHFLFVLLIALNWFLPSGYAQSTAFPYNIEITTVAGNCYDDCRIIIDIKDQAGNVIPINPQTHNAQNTNLYPIYNVQYHYRNMSASTNTQNDTVNDIQVSIGTYCIGVSAYIPDPSNTGEFLLADTTICNIDVMANYEHFEASVLSTWARNNYETYDDEPREFCGLHPSFHCADRGRIQLVLTKGKFPYTVTILDDQQDTVRQEVFYQRTQTGTDSIFADYYDYYTFDQMAIGDYHILASDSCGYSIWMTINIPDAEPSWYKTGARNFTSCFDSISLYFLLTRETNKTLHDYDSFYLDSIIQYRFINPDHDTTAWMNPQSHQNPKYSSLCDTLRLMQNYCPLYGDTIYLQLYNQCEDTIYTRCFFYTNSFGIANEILSIDMNMDITPDTCIVHANSGISTQMYNYYGGTDSYIGDDLNSYGLPREVHGRFYTCPLSYDVWSELDSTLIAHAEGESFDGLVAPVVFAVDTTIPVHITLTDAKGCLLTELHDILTFNVEPASDSHYEWQTSDSWSYYISSCCNNRFISIRENGVNAYQFRQNQTLRLFESPLYNHFNFTAVCQNGQWTVTCDDTTNHTTYVNFDTRTNYWQATIRDRDCLAPGRYVFERINSCGRDTITFQKYALYRDSIVFTSEPQFEMHQICDKLIVRPISVGLKKYREYIDWITNEPYTYIDSLSLTNGPNMYVVSGVAGGYNEGVLPSGDNFVFTIPGQYVIGTHLNSDCYSITHYDTIEFIPKYIDFDLSFAIICDYLSNTGNVFTHAIQGSEPYTYYLYNQPDLAGDMIGTSSTGYFYNVPMTEGQQLSVFVTDSCNNSFYINLTAASLSQSVLAWEIGNNVGDGHCEGDTVHLSALPFSFQANYHWTGPNGFNSDTRMNDFTIPYNGESGWYVLEILNTGCATTVSDSVYIQVIRAPRVSIISDSPVCPSANVNIGFAIQGNGMVDFTVYHAGAPASGSESYTGNANDTLFLPYPILSNNTFWVDHISDNACAYQYIIDSTTIALQHIYEDSLPALNTTDGYACYNRAATLSAIAPFTTPYYVFWYDNPRQEHLLKCDTITQANIPSYCQIEHLTSDSSLYVSIADDNYCARLYGNFYYLVDMHNGNTILNAGECVRLFDSGGESHNYGNNEHFTHSFTCNSTENLNIILNQVDIAIGDTLYIYSGNMPNPDSLIISISNNSYPSSIIIPGNTVTCVFNSNWTNNREGWSIDILTEIPMTKVYGHISPIAYDTIVEIICPSATPYLVTGVPPIDISQPMDYILDTMLLVDGTCQNQLHLHLIVNATSATSIHDSLMPCQLPIVWNGISFTDYGTQTATLTNIYGCDSLVTMTVYWAPSGDSTTVFDTIVENQLPYHINGLTFNGPGTQIATLSTANGCDSIVTMHLHVYYNVTADADTVICDNELPLVWNGATFTQSDTQTVVLTNIHGADSTLTMYVTVHPTHHTILKDTICQRTPYDNHGFILSALETATSGTNTFTQILNNAFGCDSIVDLQMLITPDITPNFYADPDKAILSENPNIQFINTTDISDIAQLNYYWIWDFGDETRDTTTEYNTEHLYTQWGDYTVTLTLMVNDCESHFSSDVIIEADLKFPNVITPNGDGVNDVFIIKDLNPDRTNKLYIADRWGKKVFEQTNYQTYMKDDIVYNAESGFGMGNLSEGVYFYTFYYEGAVRTLQFNGTITIFR